MYIVFWHLSIVVVFHKKAKYIPKNINQEYRHVDFNMK